MEIYFDKRTIKILRYIRRCRDRGTSWGNLRRKYKESANVFLLESLSKERYIATKNEKGEWIDFKDWGGNSNQEFRSYCAPRGNEFLEKRLFNFWKWVLPTIISTLALIVSVLSAIFPGIIKVILLK